jgi:hypothetical protein
MAKSPDQIVADIDRMQNEEDLDLVPRAGRMLRDKLNEDLTGGAYVGNRLDVGKDRGSRLGRMSKEDSDLLMKTDAMNKANPSRMKNSMAKAMGIAMKKGGKVSSASKRADGCAIRGKTKGRMV